MISGLENRKQKVSAVLFGGCRDVLLYPHHIISLNLSFLPAQRKASRALFGDQKDGNEIEDFC